MRNVNVIRHVLLKCQCVTQPMTHANVNISLVCWYSLPTFHHGTGLIFASGAGCDRKRAKRRPDLHTGNMLFNSLQELFWKAIICQCCLFSLFCCFWKKAITAFLNEIFRDIETNNKYRYGLSSTLLFKREAVVNQQVMSLLRDRPVYKKLLGTWGCVCCTSGDCC